MATLQSGAGATAIAVLANDIDASDTGLTVTNASIIAAVPPAPGTVVSTNGNTVSVTPAPGFNGLLTVQYTITDGAGSTSTSVALVTVLPVALPPVALPDVATTAQGMAVDINVIANDVDVAGGGLTLVSGNETLTLPPAAGGSVTVVGDKLRYTPPAGFAGVATLSYIVNDANGRPATGLATVVVTPSVLAVPPIAVPDIASLNVDSPAQNITVLANDLDLAGGGLNLVSASITASLPPSNGHTVGTNGNQVRFTPAPGFIGAVVISYVVQDSNGTQATGLLNVVVSPLAVVLGPVAVPDVGNLAQNAPATDFDVASNDLDLAGSGLTVTGASLVSTLPPSTSSVSVSAGKVRFTPAAGFVGVAVISYSVADINGAVGTGVLTVVVSPLATVLGPVAIPDVATVAQNSSATDMDVVANDVNLAGGNLTLSSATQVLSVPLNNGHTIAMVANKLRFTPAAGFAGAVTLSYEVTDTNGATGTGLVNIVVTPTALAVPPIAIPDVQTVAQNSGSTDIDVLGNDLDISNTGLILQGASITLSVPLNGATVSVVGNAVRFTPDTGFVGNVAISYTVQDGNGSSSMGVLNVVVAPALPLVPAIAVPDVATISTSAFSSTTHDIDVLSNDINAAGGALTLNSASILTALPLGGGSVSVVAGKVRYIAPAAYLGVVTVNYSISNSTGLPSLGVLVITVGL